MPQIKDITRYLETWAPSSYAEDYDNVGLLVGDASEEVKGILVSLDCTEDVVDEAVKRGCNMILSHHPILFRGLKRLTGANYVERTLLKAIRNNVALYAIHTNLDNVSTGVNRRICDRLGLEKVRILEPKSGKLMKITFFVPDAHAEKVRNALFQKGAGVIGNYSGCSFNVEGIGTFHPEEGSNPAVGTVGKTQQESEDRIEMMFPDYLQSQVLSALFESHPYEEVAYYLHSLENPNQYVGSGMIGELGRPLELNEFLADLKSKMGAKLIRHTAPTGQKIHKVAVCGGSGSFLLKSAIRQKADIFITGDFKYHEFFDADNSIVIADIGHYESEQFTIDLITEKVRRKFTTFATHLTEVNTNPIHYF